MLDKLKQCEFVKLLIRSAFPNAQKKDFKPLSHDECVYFRSRLSILMDDDVLEILPQVLEDLLNTHTNRPDDSEYVEAVVQHLNVFVEGTDFDFVESYWGKSVLSKTLVDEEYLRNEKLKTYSKFTQQQSVAIFEWLKLAREWPDLKWNIDEVDLALLYWGKRSQTE